MVKMKEVLRKILVKLGVHGIVREKDEKNLCNIELTLNENKKLELLRRF